MISEGENQWAVKVSAIAGEYCLSYSIAIDYEISKAIDLYMTTEKNIAGAHIIYKYKRLQSWDLYCCVHHELGHSSR